MINRVLKIVLASSAALIAVSAASIAVANSYSENPYSPTYSHEYRHGVVPSRETWKKMNHWRVLNPAVALATGPETLSFGGGIDGIGVTSGSPKVYLVVYGNQWGSASTDANGNLTTSGDTKSALPYLQQMFKGLGTGNERWSGTMTQYCDGPLVAAQATSCPSAAPHVGYPTGGALAGIWYDNSVASPSAANGNQLANEAIKAAAHFGNTTAASNRYVQYVILSPTGTQPDGFNTPSGGFCAWHDYNGDTTLSGGAAASNYGDIAFTNFPYVTDAGASCGQGFVNTGNAGTLDGVSIVEGHEYAETVTDQNPAGGWTNHTGNATYNGQENGDECAWISSGTGASANVTMGNGVYAMQSSWSNDTNSCAISHVIVITGTGGGGTPAANFSVVVSGLTATFTDSSTDNGGTIGTHSWTFGDGKTSTATSPANTYTSGGTYSVSETVSDSVNGTTSTKTTSVTVSGGSGGGTVLTNNVPVAGLSSTAPNWTPVYTLVVPAGKSRLTISISGGTGDADLYVKLGSGPTLTSYNCRPYLTGNNETCTFRSPAAGTYYIDLNAYATFSGVTLVGKF